RTMYSLCCKAHIATGIRLSHWIGRRDVSSFPVRVAACLSSLFCDPSLLICRRLHAHLPHPLSTWVVARVHAARGGNTPHVAPCLRERAHIPGRRQQRSPSPVARRTPAQPRHGWAMHGRRNFSLSPSPF
ncbi:hypothetical protein IAQ61_009912, partial [Plenodomus lingam]|uniref:uncharacterized protein n=1 Tax=Leptosphaeria maculans TaxID=5022 RepID=UPI003324CCD3